MAWLLWAFPVALGVKNSPANVGDVRDVGWIPGSGRSLGGGQGNPLQYSCLGLVSYSPWDHKESDMNEVIQQQQQALENFKYVYKSIHLGIFT